MPTTPTCPECEEPMRLLGLSGDTDAAPVDRVRWYVCRHCRRQFGVLIGRAGKSLRGIDVARKPSQP